MLGLIESTLPSQSIKFWSFVPPLTFILETVSFTLSIPGKILMVFKISGSIKPGKIPNFSVFKTILPSSLFCNPVVKK